MEEKIKQFKETVEKQKAEFKDLCRSKFTELTKELFETNPDLESFGFKCYANYFNDGDICSFEVYGDYPDINGVDGYNIDADSDSDNQKLENLQLKVREFINAFPTELFEDIYGNDTAVTIYRDGKTEIEEYTEHD